MRTIHKIYNLASNIQKDNWDTQSTGPPITVIYPEVITLYIISANINYSLWLLSGQFPSPKLVSRGCHEAAFDYYTWVC